jgi:hypothetical protein
MLEKDARCSLYVPPPQQWRAEPEKNTFPEPSSPPISKYIAHCDRPAVENDIPEVPIPTNIFKRAFNFLTDKFYKN